MNFRSDGKPPQIYGMALIPKSAKTPPFSDLYFSFDSSFLKVDPNQKSESSYPCIVLISTSAFSFFSTAQHGTRRFDSYFFFLN